MRQRLIPCVLAIALTLAALGANRHHHNGLRNQSSTGDEAGNSGYGASNLSSGTNNLGSGSRRSEIHALRQAYSLLSSANHDYEGHRTAAMQSVRAAERLLGTSSGANAGASSVGGSVGTSFAASVGGSAGASGGAHHRRHSHQESQSQQSQLEQEQLQQAQLQQGLLQQGLLQQGQVENQGSSDERMRRAQGMLQEVRGSVTGRNQRSVVQYVDNAIHHITVALSIK
jgi:hypothetical protein